ncbi:hypothetical protein AAG906_035502 [Vitis piasezkii]
MTLMLLVPRPTFFSPSTCQLPTKAQELLDSIVVLEITLTEERNERRLSEYYLMHFPIPVSSGLHCCPTHSTKTIIEPHGEDEEDGEMDDLPLWLDVNEDPKHSWKGGLDKKYKNLKTGTSFAIKIIDKEKILKVGMVDQIKREISVMRLVRHQNVVNIYEVMASKMKIYFVMEYAEGRSFSTT